jgi:hypothetical protein
MFHNNYNFDNVSDSKPTNNPLRTISKLKKPTKKFIKSFSKSKNMIDDLPMTNLGANNFYT